MQNECNISVGAQQAGWKEEGVLLRVFLFLPSLVFPTVRFYGGRDKRFASEQEAKRVFQPGEWMD